MAIQVMLDLETMSQRSNASIASIGAVKFDTTGILDEFYTTVNIKTCKDVGLRIDKETVQWWMEQSKEARDMLKIGNVSIQEALDLFSDWFGRKSLQVWGNGATFDNVIMESAYIATEKTVPWKWWDNRCYRTVKSLIVVPEDERQGVYHNALDDAKHQARHLIKILGS